MFRLNCPSCGAEVPFQSKASVFAVCQYCNSTLLREDEEVKRLGEMAALQDDVSPLQLGTTGRTETGSFVLIGRIRLSWQHGSWDEWYFLEEARTPGWLGHAQGFYMVSYQIPLAAETDISTLRPGASLTLKGETYQVDDIKQVQCTFSEGELPYLGEKGSIITSIDLSGPNNSFASFSASGTGVIGYVGRYFQFKELSFQHVRALDGWQP